MKKLHLICNAHIDPIWQWTWDEGISSALSTFKSAVELADEFDYIFCHNESLLYEAIESYAPELFEKIKKLVEKGKWKITGGWYLQPDCLMPSGESFVRQISVGKKYFKEKFGVEPTVATNFDSFGHSLGLVQILAKNGYNGYMVCRPNTSQFHYPSKFFDWVSPDGSKVKVTETFSYSSPLGKAAEKIRESAEGITAGMLGSEKNGEDKADVGDVDYVLWGVGNHGGGPSRKDLGDIKNLKIDGFDIFHSYPENLFFDDIKTKGEVKTSLVTCMPGCYSSMAKVKQAFRRTENLFFATEKMIAVASADGLNFDKTEFEWAQKKLLLSEFHDILPGTCIEEGEREGLGLLASCEKVMKDYRTKCFLFLTVGDDKAKEGEYPVFVFNYQPIKIKTPVEFEFSLADQNWDENTHYFPVVFDEDGNEILTQTIKEDSTLNLDWRKRAVFEAKLKPLGITRFTVKLKGVSAKSWGIEKGRLSEIFVKGLLDSPVGLFVYEDNADPWGMAKEQLEKMGKNPKPFSLMTEKESGDFIHASSPVPPIRKIEDGKVMTSVEAFYSSERTFAAVQYKKYNNFPFVDLKITVEFGEKDSLVRVKIPLPENFEGGKAIGDGPFIIEEKPESGEIYFRNFLGVKGKDDKIFAVINDGVYAGTIEEGYICVTLLRGSGYCMHPIYDKQLFPEDRYLPRIDSGRYVYNFRLAVGNIDEISEIAEEFNQKPYAVNIFPTGGNKRNKPSLTAEGKITVPVFKNGENGGYIARVFNPTREKQPFKLTLDGVVAEGVAKPCEVVSVVFKDGKFSVVYDGMPV